MDGQGWATDDGIVAAALHIAGDSSRMDVVLDGVELARWGETVSQEVRDVVEKGRPQRLFFIPRPTRRSDYWVRWMGGSKTSGQVLRGQHLKMIGYREFPRLRMQVIGAGDPVASGDETQARILDSL